MNFFSRCRRSDKFISFKKKLSKTIFVIILGLLLGIIYKYIDTIVDDGTWFKHFISSIDLSGIMSRTSFWAIIGIMIAIDANSPLRALLNVLLFFVGALGACYGYSYFISNYTMILELQKLLMYGGIISILSMIIWYSKGEGWFSIAVSTLIIGFFFREAFAFGMWYISIKNIAELIILIWSIIILHSNITKSSLTILYSLPVAIIFDLCLPYIGM